MHFSINDRAVKIVEEQILPRQEQLQIFSYQLSNGTTVIDMGLHAKAGWEAAKLFTISCLGGLGEVRYQTMMIGGHLMPVAVTHVDRPGIAEMSSHCALLRVPYRGIQQTISGPIRARLCLDKFAASLDYRDDKAEKYVCHVQIDSRPDEELAESIAEAVQIRPDQMYLLAVRTGSLAGAININARNIEQAMPSAFDQGFDMNWIIQASGYAPIVSVVDDETVAMGRVNDCMIYGQETNLYVDCEDSAIEKVLPILPFSKNQDVYGTPFLTLFAQCGNDWAKVPRTWDAPCKVNFHNMRTGNSFSTGALHQGVLTKAFLGD